MKKYIYAILAAAAVMLSGCRGFDDSGYLKDLEDMKDRIEKLRGDIESYNTQLEALSAIASGNVITSVAEDSDGNYVITYLDSKNAEKTVVVAAKANMINVPLLGVEQDQESKIWYWTLSVEGAKQFLLDKQGQKIPVSGKTPLVSVDAEGYWAVDGVRIVNEAGNPVSAASGSATVFGSISTNASGDLAVVLGDGTPITLPMQQVLNLTLSASTNTEISDVSLPFSFTYETAGTAAPDALVAIAHESGLKATLNRETQSVEVMFVPDAVNPFIVMVAWDKAEHTVIRPVFFSLPQGEIPPVDPPVDPPVEPTDPGIYTAADLYDFAAAVNAGASLEKWQDAEGVVRLLADIDMKSVETGSAPTWVPIGNGSFDNPPAYSGASFKGVFDGQGHVIKNLELDFASTSDGEVYGLFGILDGAVVKNFMIGAPEGDSGRLALTANSTVDAGLVAGVAINSSIADITNYASITISDCTVGKRATAAMLGYVFGSGDMSKVENLCNYGAITGNQGLNEGNGATSPMVAGIIAFCNSQETGNRNFILGCKNYGDITSSTARASGIIAAMNKSTEMSDCVNFGNQFNTCALSGGGRPANLTCIMGSNCVMRDCENHGDVIATNSATRFAGMVSLLNADDVQITGGGNYGRIIGDNTSYKGLLVSSFSKFGSVSNVTAGGSIGLYNGGDYNMIELTKDNYMSYIGNYKAANLSKITNIIFPGAGGTEPENPDKVEAKLSILFIGNSFTKDAVEHMPALLAAAGIKDVYMVHMYYGGRTVPEYEAGYSTVSDYHCYTCLPGETAWTDVLGKTIESVVKAQPWDVVTIQEHTGNYVAWTWSDSEKAAYQGLVDKINASMTKSPDYWYIMSQAYFNMGKIGSASKPYMTFNTQLEMYEVIAGVGRQVMNDIPFKGILATGTMLQNLRTSRLDNEYNLTRDGYHMDLGLSRYGASCLVFESLVTPVLGVNLDDNTWRYNVSDTTDGSYTTAVTDDSKPYALAAARYAIQKPFEITDMSAYGIPGGGIGDIDYNEGGKE